MSLSSRLPAQHAVDPFADEVDQPLALAHIEFNSGIFAEEVPQAGQQEMAGQRAKNVNAQQPLGLGAPKCRLGILEISDECETAPGIGFHVERRTDMSR